MTDAANQPLCGVRVTFTVTPGSGSVGSSTAVTDATGTATPGVWTLGTSFGTMALVAAVEGLSPVNITARAIAPDASVLGFALTDPANDTLSTPSRHPRPSLSVRTTSWHCAATSSATPSSSP